MVPFHGGIDGDGLIYSFCSHKREVLMRFFINICMLFFRYSIAGLLLASVFMFLNLVRIDNLQGGAKFLSVSMVLYGVMSMLPFQVYDRVLFFRYVFYILSFVCFVLMVFLFFVVVFDGSLSWCFLFVLIATYIVTMHCCVWKRKRKRGHSRKRNRGQSESAD